MVFAIRIKQFFTNKHGYRKIELIGKNLMINNPDKWSECMYKMEKNDKNDKNELIEDLITASTPKLQVDAFTRLYNEDGLKHLIKDTLFWLRDTFKVLNSFNNLNK